MDRTVVSLLLACSKRMLGKTQWPPSILLGDSLQTGQKLGCLHIYSPAHFAQIHQLLSTSLMSLRQSCFVLLTTQILRWQENNFAPDSCKQDKNPKRTFGFHDCLTWLVYSFDCQLHPSFSKKQTGIIIWVHIHPQAPFPRLSSHALVLPFRSKNKAHT